MPGRSALSRFRPLQARSVDCERDIDISGIILSFPLVIGAVAQMAELYISPNHTRAACASLQLTPLSQFHI